MELHRENVDRGVEGDAEEMDREPSSWAPAHETIYQAHYPGAVRLKVYIFDGLGFSPLGQSLLSEIPSVESPNYVGGERKERGGIMIREHVQLY